MQEIKRPLIRLTDQNGDLWLIILPENTWSDVLRAMAEDISLEDVSALVEILKETGHER